MSARESFAGGPASAADSAWHAASAFSSNIFLCGDLRASISDVLFDVLFHIDARAPRDRPLRHPDSRGPRPPRGRGSRGGSSRPSGQGAHLERCYSIATSSY